MPPSPSGTAPPGPPTIYEPRTTPGEQRMKGGAEIAMSLADMLNNWSDKFYKQEAAAAEYKGTQAGTLEGLTESQVELRGGETIYDRAFNIGALEAYKGRIRLDAKRTIGEYAARHQDDVDRYDTLVGVYTQETLREQTDPQIQAFTRRIIEERALEYRSDILKKGLEDERSMHFGVWEVDLFELEKDLASAIQSGDKVAAGNKVKDIASHIATGVEAQFITASEGVEKSKKFEADAVFQTYLTLFRDEMRDGNGWTYYESFVYDNDVEMTPAVRQRIKKEMENDLAGYYRHQDRVERVQQLRVKKTQDDNFSEGLLRHSDGTLTMVDIDSKLYRRELGPTQYSALARLLDADQEEVNAKINRLTQFAIWADIYNGFDEDGKGDIGEAIAKGVSSGAIDGSTATSMLKTIDDPNFESVTKNADYQVALRQIDTQLGQASGPMAFLEPDTANTVSAARRELYNRASEGEKPLYIVDDIITRGLMQLGRDNEPGIVPRYSARNNDKTYNLKESNQKASSALASGAITHDQFIEINNDQTRYWEWFIKNKSAGNSLDKSTIEKQRREAEGG